MDQSPHDVRPLWILRLLVRARALARMLQKNKELDVDIKSAIGLSDRAAKDLPTLDTHLAQRLSRLEKKALAHPVQRNVDAVARAVGLSRIEADLLSFAVALENDAPLKLCAQFADFNAISAYRTSAIVLGHPERAVDEALRTRGTLRQTGLLSLEYGTSAPFALMEGLGHLLTRKHPRPSAILSTFMRRAPASRLSIADFSYLDCISLLESTLRGAVRRRRKGIHILLHGATGTGKTELARTLAQHIGAPLYEVPDTDEDSGPIDANRRLAGCALAQRMLSRTRALLLFDEAEDVLTREYNPFRREGEDKTLDKAWTHRLLESARAPTIWIANSIRWFDRATLRRFALVVELDPMPTTVRRAVMTRSLERAGVRPQWIDAHVRDTRLTPGEIARIGTVSRLMGARDVERIERDLAVAMKCNLSVAGPATPTAPRPMTYDLRYVNASIDLEDLTAKLPRDARGAILLHGPPGTGKSAFVQYLAGRLDVPLITARASDLLAKYVGETEQKIAALFRRAEVERAILFLDEADSLLRDRSRAVQSWEITQVNELLVQIEMFPRLLVCATNMIETLDAASMRRFAVKIKFEALLAAQALEVFKTIVRIQDERAITDRLARMLGLTLGDFAAAGNRTRMLGAAMNAESLIRNLSEELAHKSNISRVIGFDRR